MGTGQCRKKVELRMNRHLYLKWMNVCMSRNVINHGYNVIITDVLLFLENSETLKDTVMLQNIQYRSLFFGIHETMK